MPLYEYQCDACGSRFELIRKFSDPPLEVCPTCMKGPVQKLISSPAFQFKGSGWYITDYARKSGGGESKDGESKTGESKTGESKSDSQGSSSQRESKPESTSDSKSGSSKPDSKSVSDSSSTRESKGSDKPATAPSTTKDS
jgi:putative FmdB family regulatory protein